MFRSAPVARSLFIAGLVAVNLIASISIGVPASATTPVPVQTYYVSPSGLDTNSGTTEAAPFRTIQKALDAATAGATIKLAPGIYRQALFTRRAGTATGPITVKGPESGKDVAGRYKAVVYGTGGRVLSVNHSHYIFDGFTIDGQEGIPISQYPTGADAFSRTRSFKDSVQGRTTDSKLVYVGAADTSADITGILIQNMFLNGGGGECVRLRNRATDNLIVDSVIQWCGMFAKGNDKGSYKYHNAEGVYVGTSPKSTTQPMYANDQSAGNVVSRTTIHTYGSECFNVKENAHHNRIEDSDCLYNDEPATFAGSNIEFRGDHNLVKNTVVSGSRGWNVKLRSDEAKYDRGGNSVQYSKFSDSISAAIRNDQTASGPFCSNTFTNAVIAEGISIGDPRLPCDGAPADSQPPTVSITDPTEGAAVSGPVTIRATATDDVGVARVEFLDGDSLLGADTTAPYEQAWTPTTTGSRTVTARALDAQGNIGTAQVAVTVTIAGAPVLTPPTNLTGRAASATEVQLNWSAGPGNPNGVYYDVYRNAIKVGTTQSGSFTDTGLAPSTTYSYFVRTVDTAGNESEDSATVNVTTKRGRR